jgi:hypothetical protein
MPLRLSIGGSTVAQRFAPQHDAMRCVHHGIQDRVGQSRLGEVLVPGIHRQLARDQRGAAESIR